VPSVPMPSASDSESVDVASEDTEVMAEDDTEVVPVSPPAPEPVPVPVPAAPVQSRVFPPSSAAKNLKLIASFVGNESILCSEVAH
jgi:hypothetical protein